MHIFRDYLVILNYKNENNMNLKEPTVIIRRRIPISTH